MEYNSQNPQQTQQIAEQLLREGLKSNVIGLIGELGTGKTTFVQGVAQQLGILSPVTSPTFLILKTYMIPHHPHYNQLVHVDLYRIQQWEEIASIGIEDLWSSRENLILVEWADRIQAHLPSHTQLLIFESLSRHERLLRFK